jgi:F-type H+-transporting ATPase subunit delta
MASSTRQALAAAKEAISPLLGKADLLFAEELFTIGAAIASSIQLRNLLSDPSGEEKSKQGALAAVFGKAISKDALAFANKLSGLRWSKGSDLVSAFEQMGVYVVASIASRDKTLAELEDQLFAARSVVDSSQELQQALSSRQASVESKVELVSALFKGKLSAASALLVRFAVIGSRQHKLSEVLEAFGKQVSAVADRLVATVTVAAPLSAAQQNRLEAALSASYGTELNLNVEIDPSILGGVKVQVSGEIIDGSVAARLNQAKLQLA